MTAMSIDSLKEKIHPPMRNELKESEIWRFFDIANCYSYALGLLHDISHLNPGQISRMQRKRKYTDEELVECVEEDIRVLGMIIRESTLEEEVTSENSWKIAIMNADVNSIQERYDYHFLKQCPNKQWYQKIPYEQFPSKYDSRFRTITDPETATYPYHYHLVGYFVVTKK